MVGTGKTIPDKDVSDIGIPARKYLNGSEHNHVLLIDDLEYDHRSTKKAVFDRYRLALDTMLRTEEQRSKGWLRRSGARKYRSLRSLSSRACSIASAKGVPS